MDKMEYELDDLDQIINDATPDLLRKLKLDILMSSKLRKAGVLTDSIEDELKTDGLSGHKKISMFLDDLKVGPIERFLHFCRIMKEEGQYHIVDYLKVDIDIIYAQLGMEPPKPRPPSPESIEPAKPEPRPPDYNSVFSMDIPLWVKEHPNGEMYLYEDEDLEKKLIEGSPKLKQLVRTKDLWGYLQRYHIMDDMMVEQCQVGTRGEHVEAIIKHLKQGEVWRTHAFFRSLAQIDQAGLIDQVLGKGHKQIYMENLLEK